MQILYDKAYNDMQQKIERLQAQLGDLKGKNNTKTRGPQPRSNIKNDRVPSAFKSSRSKNKEVEVKEHHRKLLLSRNKKHMSSECNNVKHATQNVKSKVVCATFKQCLNSVNHDTDDELTKKELKQIEADDQAIQTILLDLPEDIYAVEKKAKLFNEWERFTSNKRESIESYYHRFLKLMNDLKRYKHFSKKIANDELSDKELKQIEVDDQTIQTILLGLPEDIYAARISSNPRNRQIAQLGMNMGQDRQMQMVGGNGRNQFRQYAGQNAGNPAGYNDVIRNQKEEAGIQLQAEEYDLMVAAADRDEIEEVNANCILMANLQQVSTSDITDPTTAMNMALALMAKAFKLNYSTSTNNNQRISSYHRNKQIAQPWMNMGNGNQNQIRNGNLMAARAEGNAAGQNRNQIRCCNCRGNEEAGIQLQSEEYDLMAAAADLDEIEEVNANCILMANLQQASTSGTQTDSASVYDIDGSAEVHENCDDNEIFNMFTQEEQYTELLEPIPESHQVPQNDNNVISEDTSVEQGGETVEQYPANFEETRALYESSYQNLAIEVEKVNSVNRKLKETNADLTTELAR
nr:hypothetical protein [Tanacetum cinerariifolium]